MQAELAARGARSVYNDVGLLFLKPLVSVAGGDVVIVVLQRAARIVLQLLGDDLAPERVEVAPRAAWDADARVPVVLQHIVFEIQPEGPFHSLLRGRHALLSLGKVVTRSLNAPLDLMLAPPASPKRRCVRAPSMLRWTCSDSRLVPSSTVHATASFAFDPMRALSVHLPRRGDPERRTVGFPVYLRRSLGGETPRQPDCSSRRA